jgi:hypothetical protein
MKITQNQVCKNQKLRQFIAAILLLSSSLGTISPVLAQVAAGSPIKNTATAKFKDDGGTEYNSTSNEIVIKVAEVAGINITAQTPSAINPNVGDTLYVDFVITNTGNDPTQFFIPGTATLSDTTNFSQNGKLQIVAVNGTNLVTAVDVPNAGDNTGDLLTNGSIPANFGNATNGKITVRVPIKVAIGAAVSGKTLTVSLGNTSTKDTQDKERSIVIDTNDVNTNDVYTVDNADKITDETAGTPQNGDREAMATSSTITVNARQQAFATVLKAISSYSTGVKPEEVSDDILTYALALKVENPTPSPDGFVASDLHGTGIKVDNATTTPYVLVSDAIPAGMKLGTANPVAPTGWQVVYTTDDLTVNALKADWLTNRPTAGTITRVGYIYNTTTTPLPKGAPAITGFTFTVTPDTFTDGQIANIAQTFGQSQPGAVVPGTATQIVYDESGDKTYNNGLDGANPDPTTKDGVTPENGGITDGKADPAADGSDPGTGTDPTANDTNQGNDTGTGTGAGTKKLGGEDNIYVVATTPLNGPSGKPGATGPTSTNDDFTNKSIVVPPAKNPSDTLTDDETTPITFNNTVKNTSGSQQIISLLPTPPVTPGDLIDGTKVTIKDASGNTAKYIYTKANGFTFDSGTGGTSATNPIKVTVAAGDVANYEVIVDLPAAPQLQGFPVPITAFVDVNNDGKPAGEPSNITIDRVYTNYLKLEKKARLLEADGKTLVFPTTDKTYTTDQTALSASAKPGRIIEYQITYTNISTTGGTDSVILNAKELVITENGSTGSNTWFSTTLDSKYPTLAIGSAEGTSVTVTTATNGTATDIQEYNDAIANVAPGEKGTFTFQRKIK